jgi:hypothetical protein
MLVARGGVFVTIVAVLVVGTADPTGAGPLPGGSPAAGPETTTAAPDPAPAARCLDVAWLEIATIPPILFDTMAAEVGRLLSPAEVCVSWTPLHPDTARFEQKVRVVLMASEALRQDGQPILGSTHPKAPTPTVRVYFPTLLGLLGVPQGRIPTMAPLSRRKVGIALGRVVAHELVHALRPRLPHSSHGLMAPLLSRAGLLRGYARINEQTLTALQNPEVD